MELEAAHAQGLGLVPCVFNCLLAAARIHRTEGNQHVIVPRAAFHQVVDGVRLMAQCGARIDREDHRCHLLLAIELRNAVDGRGPVFRLEIGRRGIEEVFRHGLVAAFVDFKMHVHIDGVQSREVDS